MGKRKNTDAVSSPEKEKKATMFEASPKKRNAESSDSDSDDNYEESNAVEAEETRHEEGPSNYEPDRFRMLVESFQEYIGVNQFSSSVHNMEKPVAEWLKTHDEVIDSKYFIADFRKYLKHAIKFRNFSLNDACIGLMSYLSGEKSLVDFPTYPDKPQTKFQLYVKKKKIEFKGVNGSLMKSIHARMQGDEAGSREVDQELHDLNAQFIPQLKEFLDLHPHLTEDQKKYICNKIRLLERKVNPKPVVSKTPKTSKSKKEQKEEETAFSLFCKSKNDKYRDLSEEEREKKLMKKFAKLPDEMRQIFENLALTL